MTPPIDLVDEYSARAEEYDQHYRSPADQAEDLFLAAWLDRLGAFDSPDVLDVGCGTGALPAYARSRLKPFFKTCYVGIDPAPGMVARARAKFPRLSFHVGSAELAHQLPYPATVVALFGPYNYAPESAWFALRDMAPRRFIGVFYSIRPRARDDYSAPDQRRLFPAADLRDRLRACFPRKTIDVRGFSHPAYPRLPARWHSTYLALEHRTIGCWFPDRCSFLLATAT